MDEAGSEASSHDISNFSIDFGSDAAKEEVQEEEGDQEPTPPQPHEAPSPPDTGRVNLAGGDHDDDEPTSPMPPTPPGTSSAAAAASSGNFEIFVCIPHMGTTRTISVDPQMTVMDLKDKISPQAGLMPSHEMRLYLNDRLMLVGYTLDHYNIVQKSFPMSVLLISTLSGGASGGKTPGTLDQLRRDSEVKFRVSYTPEKKPLRCTFKPTEVLKNVIRTICKQDKLKPFGFKWWCMALLAEDGELLDREKKIGDLRIQDCTLHLLNIVNNQDDDDNDEDDLDTELALHEDAAPLPPKLDKPFEVEIEHTSTIKFPMVVDHNMCVLDIKQKISEMNDPTETKLVLVQPGRQHIIYKHRVLHDDMMLRDIGITSHSKIELWVRQKNRLNFPVLVKDRRGELNFRPFYILINGNMKIRRGMLMAHAWFPEVKTLAKFRSDYRFYLGSEILEPAKSFKDYKIVGGEEVEGEGVEMRDFMIHLDLAGLGGGAGTGVKKTIGKETMKQKREKAWKAFRAQEVKKRYDENIAQGINTDITEEMRILKRVHDSIRGFVATSKAKGIDEAFRRAAFRLKPEVIGEILVAIDPKVSTHGTTPRKLTALAELIFRKMDLLVALDAKIASVRSFACEVIEQSYTELREQDAKWDLGLLTVRMKDIKATIEKKIKKGMTLQEIYKEEVSDDDQDEDEDDLDVEEMARALQMQATVDGEGDD